MPLLFTRSRLRDICRRRVDMKKNQARSNDDFNELMNEQYGELWGVASENGGRYFEKSSSITADGSESYTEPTDQLSYVRMAHVLSDGREEPLYEIEAREEWRYKGLTGDARRYTIVDDQVFLYPKPSSGTYKLYYIQQPTDLTLLGDGDSIDVINMDGLKFLVWGVAVLVHGELEGNALLALKERDAARDRLHWWCVQRALNAPRRHVIEPASTNEQEWDPSGFWNRPQ
jgi:hypothetical protein